MSSFLFERQEVDCACFQNSQSSTRKIFRSNSDFSSTFSIKNRSFQMVKKPQEKPNNKKKSLRRQKSFIYKNCEVESNFGQNQRDISNCNQVEDQISKKQDKKYSNFQQMRNQNSYFNNQKNCNFIQAEQNQTKSMVILSQQNRPQIPLKMMSYQPVYDLNIIKEKQSQQALDQEFRKDLQQFQLEMMKIKSKQKINKENKDLQNLKFQNQTKFQDYQQKEQLIQENQIITQEKIDQLQREIEKIHLQNHRNRPLRSRKKSELQKVGSSPQICLQNVQKQLLPANVHKKISNRRQRKQSFRYSIVTCNDRQIQTKRIKDRLYANQVESQKDGTSNESDNISEVVARGWDGLTEQRIEIERLDEIIDDQKKNGQTQTMITHQSNIKNSQIKTFTDYSASFISPKTHRHGSILFGGGIAKFGASGMSYQNIDDLRRLKTSLHQDFKF